MYISIVLTLIVTLSCIELLPNKFVITFLILKFINHLNNNLRCINI